MGQFDRIPYQQCPLCKSDKIRLDRQSDATYHPRYKDVLPCEMKWMTCDICDHQFTSGYFGDDALAVLFAESNAGQETGGDFEGARWNSARMVQRVSKHLASGRWLDVGFGNASLIFTADEFGYEAVGLDLRKQSVDKLRQLGYEAYCEDISNFVHAEKFDVISMADVLEHMPYPKTGLSAAYNLMRPGGILLISMPNADSAVWKLLDKYNPYWAELEHYHNFGRRRLYSLLRELGFESMEYGVSERYRACMEVIAVRT